MTAPGRGTIGLHSYLFASRVSLNRVSPPPSERWLHSPALNSLVEPRARRGYTCPIHVMPEEGRASCRFTHTRPGALVSGASLVRWPGGIDGEDSDSTGDLL